MALQSIRVPAPASQSQARSSGRSFGVWRYGTALLRSIACQPSFIRGEKRIRQENRGARIHVMECAYGRFERALSLPAELDGNAAKASYRRGVLHIQPPKKSVTKVRRIELRYSRQRVGVRVRRLVETASVSVSWIKW